MLHSPDAACKGNNDKVETLSWSLQCLPAPASNLKDKLNVFVNADLVINCSV